MLELFNYNFTELEIQNIKLINKDTIYLNNNEIQKKLDVLKRIDCNNRQIRNIIISNPFFLTNIDEDVLKLIDKLISLKITNINLLFDSNPSFLNYEVYIIEQFINNKLKENMKLEDIVDLIDNNPYIIEE